MRSCSSLLTISLAQDFHGNLLFKRTERAQQSTDPAALLQDSAQPPRLSKFLHKATSSNHKSQDAHQTPICFRTSTRFWSYRFTQPALRARRNSPKKICGGLGLV